MAHQDQLLFCNVMLLCHLQNAVAAKTEQLAASAARCGELELQLARAHEQAAANSQRLASLKVAADSAARAQAEAAVQRQEALASLELARAELEKVQQQLALAQSAAEKKGQEVRELNHMLKAWEAMRLGKDAQVCLSPGGYHLQLDTIRSAGLIAQVGFV